MRIGTTGSPEDWAVVSISFGPISEWADAANNRLVTAPLLLDVQDTLECVLLRKRLRCE